MGRIGRIGKPRIAEDKVKEETLAIEVRGLRHSYPSKRSRKGPQPPRGPALDGITFDVRSGEVFGLLGPNGGGKTTLSRILCTLIVPDEGSAKVQGIDAVLQPAEVRRQIGVVFQSESLDRRLTVRENLKHQGHLYAISGGVLESRIEELLVKFGLKDRSSDKVGELSGGLKRRVELAKSLLHRPKILLMDEPTTGVDPGARQDFWSHIFGLRGQENTTILVTTHLMEEAEKCDRLAILDRGKLVALGTPESLKSEIGGDVVSVETQDPDKLAGQVRDRFKVSPEVLDGALRIEWPKGHSFIPELIEAFPGQIRSVRISKPSLEDVFIHRTRRSFWQPS